MEHAAKIGNDAEACRVSGVSRNNDCDSRNKAEACGVSALLPKQRRKPHQPKAMSSEEVADHLVRGCQTEPRGVVGFEVILVAYASLLSMAATGSVSLVS